MTQEEKQLLLQDLCARLPYKCKYKASKGITHWHKLTLSTETINKIIDDYYDEIKPYLRPMSSMTEEEENEYRNIDNRSYSCPMDYAHIPASDRIDWLNAHHFDYRGLIKKGLAIEVTEKNNPYET